MSAYLDREQTQAKHFILRLYLQELAYKVLRGWDIAYIDGFSGPWKSKTDDFSDTSFMIALRVLAEAQRIIHEQTGHRRKIRCFFSEKNVEAYKQMVATVAHFHRPEEGFEVKTFPGEFVDAVAEIRTFIGSAFPLIFIDPTGWTEYPFTRIAPLFAYGKCEVLINFMYGHISRFLNRPSKQIIASLDPILGGPGWQNRLARTMANGPAVEKLFRETLKDAGAFRYVISTRIDKSTQERPHFFLAYGTKDRAGLIAFRNTEYKALREHARNRSAALTRKRDQRAQMDSLFGDFDATQKAESIDDLVEEQKVLAEKTLLDLLTKRGGSCTFIVIVDVLLQAFMLRETNVKDICVELARKDTIANTWGPRVRKPSDDTTIRLLSAL